MATENCIKVKRDGPRGWHWIAADVYDPAVHQLADDHHPLDHDGNGKKGGSLPQPDHVHAPADYEVDGKPAPSARKPRNKKATG